MRTGAMGRRLAGALFFLLGTTGWAAASPWGEVGDTQLRADIEVLATAGLIDGVTTPWPLPWTALVPALKAADLDAQPPQVQAAALRVLGRAMRENRPGFGTTASVDVASAPALVRGFDSLGRGDGQTQVALSYSSSAVSARLAVGGYTQTFHTGATKLALDDSYLAVKAGDALVYGGWLTHWWGPGWISALSLSNNARPMPQVGIQRLDTSPSTWPVLEWLGPWQAEFFLGLLDGPRLQRNTVFDALRITVNPAPGLEIGLARTGQICGQGHTCDPAQYFQLNNSPTDVNKTNDEGVVDIKYGLEVWGVPVQAYMQLMNEDSSPVTHSGTSHLFGATVFVPVAGQPLRLTVEYADSISTTNVFSFASRIYGFSYTNGGYPDGMRYRGRTIGFSLDDDSRLLSLQGSWRDADGWTYELTLHHAVIGTAQSAGANIVSPVPVKVNILEGRLSLPFRHVTLDLRGSVQDDQARPDHGFQPAVEAALRIAL
ncbi:capsule assembly Wzi family protein [Azospirillum sp. B4]|uniref:capsule assembly Wzi family protein n=1 Tax=Azospirillum sp. B4 TaxID=95605 RepID=UPI00034B74B0|nr:capsule assembly Wzi family protein [Azospirillum sp. B4]